MLNSRMLLIGAVVLAGCGSLGLRGQQTPYDGSLSPNRPFLAPHTVNGRGAIGGGTSVICRGGSSGYWIAIDYLADGQGCGTIAKKTTARYPYALVIDYRPYQIGATLEVCGDEVNPSGWVTDEWEVPDGRCPPDTPTDENQKTVKRIRRVR